VNAVKIGLKLFSSNIESIESAKRYYQEGLLDYIELMPLPNMSEVDFIHWRDSEIPINIHSPHSQYGFNLSLSAERDSNRVTFDEIRFIADTFNSEYIIVHPGVTGRIEETIFQINDFNDKRITVENMPFVALSGKKCICSTPEEIQYVINQTNASFCFDNTHSAKSSFSNGFSMEDYIKKFLHQSPTVVHICGIKRNGYYDEHLNFFNSEISAEEVLSPIVNKLKQVFLTLEIPEKDYKSLMDFKRDASTVRDALKKINHSQRIKI